MFQCLKAGFLGSLPKIAHVGLQNIGLDVSVSSTSPRQRAWARAMWKNGVQPLGLTDADPLE